MTTHKGHRVVGKGAGWYRLVNRLKDGEPTWRQANRATHPEAEWIDPAGVVLPTKQLPTKRRLDSGEAWTEWYAQHPEAE